MAVKIGNIKGSTGAKGATGLTGPTGPPGPTVVSSDASNAATLGSDNLIYVPTVALATPSQTGLLRQTPNDATKFVDGTDNYQDLVTVARPIIQSVRQYNWNAIGNPNFEVAQRNCGNAVNIGNWVEDRWLWSGTLVGTAQRIIPVAPINDPVTALPISNGYIRLAVGTQKTSLAAGDACYLQQIVEGPLMRPLMNSHSLSILVRSSVAPVKFGLGLRTYTSPYYSLVTLATYTGPANTWQLLQFPNLAVWSGSATWPNAPQAYGYVLFITPASGTTLTTAPNVWSSGNFIAATGQDNFWANPAGSTLDIGFVQHEPGPYCSYLMDIPFAKNLQACQRHYAKSVAYDQLSGTANAWSGIGFVSNSTSVRCSIRFPVSMAAAAPAVTIMDNVGTANKVYPDSVGSVAISSVSMIDSEGIGTIILATAASYAGVLGMWHASSGM